MINKKKLWLSVFAVFTVFIFTGSCKRSEKNQIFIGSAMSLKEPLLKIAAEFKKKYGISVRFAFASSGVISTQIRAGLPVDVYLSANRAFVDSLVDTNFADKNSQFDFISNQLVLIRSIENKNVNEFKDIENAKRIACGNTQTVPAGIYTRQYLEKTGMWEKLKGKMVFGEHVRQISDWVQRGEVDAGFVFKSDYNIVKAKTVVVKTVSDYKHKIRYSAAVVTASKKKEKGAKFLEFLKSPIAVKILMDHGFSPL